MVFHTEHPYSLDHSDIPHRRFYICLSLENEGKCDVEYDMKCGSGDIFYIIEIVKMLKLQNTEFESDTNILLHLIRVEVALQKKEIFCFR